MAIPDTAGEDYTARLQVKSAAAWKRLLEVQRPYRWNLRRLEPGFTLDLGCGLGRNLAHLGGGGVGIDHNPTSIAACRDAGFEAYTPEEFARTDHARPGRFDCLLASHVIEHQRTHDAEELLRAHLVYVRLGGKVILITPQERGYASDPTHVTYFDLDGLTAFATSLGLDVERADSFPFPWPLAGKVFTYNEFVVVARKRSSSAPHWSVDRGPR